MFLSFSMHKESERREKGRWYLENKEKGRKGKNIKEQKFDLFTILPSRKVN